MSRDPNEAAAKPLEWVGSSKADLIDFPAAVRKEMGYALFLAQCGEKALSVKPLKGFGGAGVLEITVAADGNAFRGVYTVKFVEAVYVLHCFQKKSKQGIATPQAEIELIKRRLKTAAEHYQQTYEP